MKRFNLILLPIIFFFLSSFAIAGDLDGVGILGIQSDADFSSAVVVAKSGGDYTTIQGALGVAAVGDTILVYPGTYTETLTIADNNLTIIGMGKPGTVIVTQPDANVVNGSTFTGVQFKNMKFQVTAATTAINTVQVSTGLLSFKECQLSMTSAAAIVASTQPAVGACTGIGTLEVKFGKAFYYHTGACGGGAIKSAFTVANGGEIHLDFLHDITITNSGTALASSLCVDAGTGIIEMHDCDLTLTDPNATIVAGMGYLGGTGTTHEFMRNEIHVVATANTGYGFFASDTASTTRTFYNHIHVEDTGGSSYSFSIAASATVVSHFDDIISDNGVTGAGTFTQVSSQNDGALTATGAVSAESLTITPSALPSVVFDDSDGADGLIYVNANDADDAVMYLSVDDSNGDDQVYVELDGVNEQVELKYNTLVAGRLSATTYGSDGSVSDAELLYINTLSSNAQTQLDARALESVVGTSIGNGLRLDGAVLKADRDFSSQAYTASGNISAAHILANKFLTNYGEDAAENDLVLPDIEYYAGVIFIIEAAYNIEINPPNADAHEALDLDGTTLDASYCVDSDSTIGSKIVATRVHLAGGWKWSLDTIRGVWTDTGASD